MEENSDSLKGMSVADLCRSISDALANGFPDEVWVRGAISGLNRSRNGHVYFSLVDPDEINGSPSALIPVTLFANDKFRVNAILKKAGSNIRMADGTEVLIRGRVEVYERQGRVQLRMTLIDPNFTLGQIEANRQALLATLEREGLLGRNGLLPFPVAPLRIALLTSGGSAAHADFVDQLAQSRYRFEVTLYDTAVQGDEAVHGVVEGLANVVADSTTSGFDVVALIRGGGARNDLVAFDHELIARAIAGCPLPVVVGVGHEIDRSVADDVAAVSTKTPTACAAHLVDAVAGFEESVNRAAERVAHAVSRQLATTEAGLVQAGHRLDRSAHSALGQRGERLTRGQQRLVTAIDRWADVTESSLREAELIVRAADPAIALARGWSITVDDNGSVVRSIDDVSDGAVLQTRVEDGVIHSTVTRTQTSRATT